MTYLSTLESELADTKQRLMQTSEEGAWIIRRQIVQIKRDIDHEKKKYYVKLRKKEI